MSKKHWTQRAARALQDEREVRYTSALNWVRGQQTTIEQKALIKDEDGLHYGDRCITKALELYTEQHGEKTT